MYSYVCGQEKRPREKRGIIFGLVTPRDREAYLNKLIALLGIDDYSRNIETFYIPPEHWHVLDTEHLTHIVKRHSGSSEIAIAKFDIQRLPQVVEPRNVVEFSIYKRMPRIVYASDYADGRLVVIQEIERKMGLVVKTLYKQKIKEGHGGHPAGR
jgi:hypothetical protein